MFECIKQSLRVIGKSRLKAFLTVGGIAIGVSSVVIISSIGEMGKSAVDNQLTDMGMDSFVVTGTESNFDGLWEDDLETLKSVPDVRNAMPLINYFTEISSRGENSPAMIWGVNEDADDVIELKTVSGRLINKSDVLSSKKVCVVDEQIAMDRYKRNTIVGKEIGISINGRVENFEVIGVVSNGVNLLQNMFGDLVPSFVYIPYTTLSEETNNRYFTQIAVKLDDETDSDSAFNALSHAVLCQRDEKTEIRVENLLKQKSQMNKIADITSKALSIVAGISLVVSGLSVMTVMLVSVKERTREIGIKKSIGAKNYDILTEFLTESVLITLIGGIIGLLFGLSVSAVAGFITGLPSFMGIEGIAFVLIFVMAIGALFGAYPAYKASKLNPVEALRSE
ncbi:MAG: ABC transporter permease [Oscillospiraceae bacterium]|nr:ABC transporter permease [Oscillospiraceae bacterium]